MLYPRLANELAMPNPIPLSEPVTSATLFYLHLTIGTSLQQFAFPG